MARHEFRYDDTMDMYRGLEGKGRDKAIKELRKKGIKRWAHLYTCKKCGKTIKPTKDSKSKPWFAPKLREECPEEPSDGHGRV